MTAYKEMQVVSRNPNALHMLFKYDYKEMKEKCQPIVEELAKRVFHPARLMRLCDVYNVEFDEYIEIIG